MLRRQRDIEHGAQPSLVSTESGHVCAEPLAGQRQNLHCAHMLNLYLVRGTVNLTLGEESKQPKHACIYNNVSSALSLVLSVCTNPVTLVHTICTHYSSLKHRTRQHTLAITHIMLTASMPALKIQRGGRNHVSKTV